MDQGTIQDSARRVARACRLEARLFEVLGAWVPITPEPDVKIVLARHSHHHAWHAELFERVLPEANGLDARAAMADVPEGWAGMLDALAALEHTAERVVAAYDVVLPAVVAEYDEWLRTVDPVRDAPLRRWLGFVVTDERADLAEGRALLSPERRAGADPVRLRLEGARGPAGALLG